jgi:pimeloyl-ACP methyl ester carboxylesterase
VRLAESRTVRSGEATIYYETYGDGPTVLIAPGGEENTLHFFETVPVLVRAGYRVIVMNLRGHYQSPCPPLFCHPRYFIDDIAAILDAELIPRAAIVGESLGGFGALRFSLERPDAAAALVLMGSYAGVHSAENFKANQRACQLYLEQIKPSVPTRIDLNRPDAARALLNRNLTLVGSDDGLTSAPLAYLTTMNDEAWWLTPAQLRGYRTPTLLIGGDRDAFLGEGFQRRLVKQIPGATLGDFQDAGHRPYWEDPERFTRDVLTFLDKHDWRP